MSKELEKILAKLEQLLPPPPPPTDWKASIAFRWRRSGRSEGWLQPVRHVHRMRLSDLQGIDPQIAKVEQNTRQFMEGKPANNVLLTGARGTGKSSIVKGLLNKYAPRGLRLIEVEKSDLADLPAITDLVANRPERFLLFCDDLTFHGAEEGYIALKVALDGSISTTSENLLIYATSNRRHLMPEYMQENLDTKYVGDEIHPGETVEEKISLSERFGLWVSFYPFDQDEYLEIVAHWLSTFSLRQKGNRAIQGRGAAVVAPARLAQRPRRLPVRAGLGGSPRRRLRGGQARQEKVVAVEVAAAVIERPDGVFPARAAPGGQGLRRLVGVPRRQDRGGRARRARARARAARGTRHRGAARLSLGDPRAYLRARDGACSISSASSNGRASRRPGKDRPSSGSGRMRRSPSRCCPPTAPVLASLALPLEYAITDAQALGAAEQLARVEARMKDGPAPGPGARQGSLGTRAPDLRGHQHGAAIRREGPRQRRPGGADWHPFQRRAADDAAGAAAGRSGLHPHGRLLPLGRGAWPRDGDRAGFRRARPGQGDAVASRRARSGLGGLPAHRRGRLASRSTRSAACARRTWTTRAARARTASR